MAELAACLSLCAPSGMSHDDRQEWLTIAFPRVADIPADLLVEACQHAQDTCDHPSKLIPTIKKFVQARWAQRMSIREALLREHPELTDQRQPWIPEPGELEQIKREAAARLRSEHKSKS